LDNEFPQFHQGRKPRAIAAAQLVFDSQREDYPSRSWPLAGLRQKPREAFWRGEPFFEPGGRGFELVQRASLIERKHLAGALDPFSAGPRVGAEHGLDWVGRRIWKRGRDRFGFRREEQGGTV
jgi:hypothetical protein